MCLCVNRVTEVFCSVVSGTLQENKWSGELKHPVTSAHVVNAQTHTKQLKQLSAIKRNAESLA